MNVGQEVPGVDSVPPPPPPPPTPTTPPPTLTPIVPPPSSASSGSNTLSLIGNNPAYIKVGSSYSDPGVNATGDEYVFATKVSVDGKTPVLVGNLALDTSTASTHSLVYTLGNLSVTRTVVVTPNLTQSNTVTTPTIKLSLTKTLSIGSKNSEVTLLQNFLIQSNYLTSGNNTGYFGNFTRGAVKKFQCARMQICSGTEATTGYGMVGKRTRAMLAK